MPVIACQFRHADLIQRRRDRADVVLRKHQLQNAGKLPAFQFRVLQNQHKLIHHIAQHLPDLRILIRQLILSLGAKQRRFVLQLLRQADLLQKIAQRRHLSARRFVLPQIPLQTQQRRAHPRRAGAFSRSNWLREASVTSAP